MAMVCVFYREAGSRDAPTVLLFGDYGSNVALYPQFQRHLREHRPPTLIVWGELDPFFTVDGARARRDLPDAEVPLLDAGHFALGTHGPESSR